MRSVRAFILLTLAIELASAQTYFPPGVLAATPAASEIAANHYAKFLKSLHEPSLFEMAQQDPKAEVYRFLWLREFDRTAAIRFVTKPGGTGWFYRRMVSGNSGTGPGRVTESGMSWCWKSRTASFLNTVDGVGFWNLPTLAANDPGDTPACRAHWIIEGIRNGQYHVVDRCSPDQAGPVRVVGTLALELGHLRVHRSSVY